MAGSREGLTPEKIQEWLDSGGRELIHEGQERAKKACAHLTPGTAAYYEEQKFQRAARDDWNRGPFI